MRRGAGVRPAAVKYKTDLERPLICSNRAQKCDLDGK
jgi:hypothetical protein